MPRAVGIDGAAEDVKPTPHHGDARQHGGEDHEQTGVKLLVETARHDQVVGHEGKRAGQTDPGKAEEQEKSRQGRCIPEPSLGRVEPDRPRPAFECPRHQSDAGERQSAGDPDAERPVEFHRQRARQPCEHHGRLAHGERADQRSQVALHDRQRCAIGRGDECHLRQHDQFRCHTLRMIGMADEQSHGRVGGHLRHRRRQRRRHRRSGKERWIPGVKRKDPLADHDGDRHQPATRRAHPARGRRPRRIDEQEHRANGHTGGRCSHGDGEYTGSRHSPRRASHRDPGRQRRGTPEDDQQDRM